MIWLYRLIYLPALLLAAPFYLRRMWRRGGYRENFAHRFGGVDALPEKRRGTRRVWLQAVSVGEVLAVAPLMERLVRQDGMEIYLTTTTSTGYRMALERYRDLTVGIGYFPLDWWWFSARAWRRIRPDLAILTEGERWPEHIRQGVGRGVPVLCINARLSDRSFRRMQEMRWAVQSLLGKITCQLPASTADEARFRQLGFTPARLQTTGNIKLDVSIQPLPPEDRDRLRAELGLGDGLVLLGSSTWPGEEEVLLDACRRARKAGIRCSLLLVPRHAERRGEIARLLPAGGLTCHFRSEGPASAKVDVAVGDTTGELRAFTQLADVVFTGKSLPPNEGGQTPVEAAALGRAIVFGPEMGNFRMIARTLVEQGAAVQVADAPALIATLTALLGDATRRDALAAAALAWQRANAGAVDRTLAVIREQLAGNGVS